MLEESTESRTIFFSTEKSRGLGNNESPASFPKPGEVRSRITGVRKLVTNYETYIAYQVETIANRKGYPSQAQVVERRYREFDWLHGRFLSIYAILFVPPLPGKKNLTQFNRCASGFVDRRCSGLQKFLKKSSCHPVLSANPDFIAFLTYSRSDFQVHMQRYPVESTLFSSLIEQPYLVLSGGGLTEMDFERQSAEVCGANDPVLQSSSSPIDAAFREAVESSVHQVSEKCARYQTEVMEYTVLCKRFSSLMDRMTNQLATLSYDHVELAKSLEDVGVLTSTSAEAEGEWASAIVSSAVHRAAHVTQALASRLSLGPAVAWHEHAAFGESVKRALKNRQAIQASYFSLDREVKESHCIEELSGHEVSQCHQRSTPGLALTDTTPSNLSFPWLARFTFMPWSTNAKKKSRPMSELKIKTSNAYRDLTFANSQVEAEWRRWESSRAAETVESLTALSSAYVAYWSSLADVWRNVSIRLKGSPHSADPQIETTYNNNICGGESAHITDVMTLGSPLKSNSVELMSSASGRTLDEVDLSTSPKEAEDIEEEKERGWTVVDLSDSPSVKKGMENASFSAS